MWNGKLVPIVNDHIVLPHELRIGMGIQSGSRLIASAYEVGTDPFSANFGNTDLLGGVLFTVVRKAVLFRLIKLNLQLVNRAGAIKEIAQILRANSGQIVQMEGVGNGNAVFDVNFRTADGFGRALETLCGLCRADSPNPNSSGLLIRSLTVTPPSLPDNLWDEVDANVKADIRQLASNLGGQDWDDRHRRCRSALLNEVTRIHIYRQKNSGIKSSEISVAVLDMFRQSVEFSFEAKRVALPESGTKRVRVLRGPPWISDRVSKCYELSQWQRERAPLHYANVEQLHVSESGIPFPKGVLDVLLTKLRDNSERATSIPDLEMPPRYVLLAGDTDEPALVCLIPNRQLFEIRVKTKSFWPRDPEPGFGVVSAISDVIERNRVNILHARIFNTESRYREHGDVTMPDYEEGEFRAIASIPKEWRGLSQSSIADRLGRLEKELEHLRIGAADPLVACREFLSVIDDDREIKELFANEPLVPLARAVKEKLERELERDLDTALGAVTEGSDEPDPAAVADSLLELGGVLVAWLRSNVAAPDEGGGQPRSVVRERAREWVEQLRSRIIRPKVQGFSPEHVHVQMPILRCFFAHSDSPDSDERRMIGNVRAMLDQLSFDIVEGQWTHGLSVDAATRSKIRRSDVLVSVMWPREARVRESATGGAFAAPEWLVHEESYAMALNKGVFRFREKGVEAPHYYRDQREYEFGRADEGSWARAIEDCQKQLTQHIAHKSTEQG